jgi:hypothetical protein
LRLALPQSQFRNLRAALLQLRFHNLSNGQPSQFYDRIVVVGSWFEFGPSSIFPHICMSVITYEYKNECLQCIFIHIYIHIYLYM